MAEDLQLNKCWFHSKGDLSHYDIPKRKISEFLDNSKIKVISTKELFKFIKNGL